MNSNLNTYYPNISTSSNPSYIPNQSTYPPYLNIPGYSDNSLQNQNNTETPTVPEPQYAENIFSMNKGKKVTVYFSYPDSIEWRDRVFYGTILESGRDYLLIVDENNQVVLLWLVYINYAIFENREISY